MTFVTDTHALIHHLTGRKRRLGQRARRTFERVERGVDTILIPFTVLEELMFLSEAGKIRLPLPFRDLVVSLAQADNFDLGVNDAQLLLEAAALVGIKDPYDRMIVAQARACRLSPATKGFANRAWSEPFGDRNREENKTLLFETSGRNLFAELGFSNPEREQLKDHLRLQICRIIKDRNITQAEAGKILGIKQPHVSALMRNRSGNLSVERLMDFLVALGQDVEITVRPTRKHHSHVSVVIA